MMKRKLMMTITVILAIALVLSFGSVAFAAGYQYFAGDVAYSYYTTADKDVYKASVDRTYTDGLWTHVIKSNNVGARYTSRLYQSGSTSIQVSNVVDKPALENGPLDATATTYQGNVRLKVHNTYNYGTTLTFVGRWYVS